MIFMNSSLGWLLSSIGLGSANDLDAGILDDAAHLVRIFIEESLQLTRWQEGILDLTFGEIFLPALDLRHLAQKTRIVE
jgi:hypothetical protein